MPIRVRRLRIDHVAVTVMAALVVVPVGACGRSDRSATAVTVAASDVDTSSDPSSSTTRRAPTEADGTDASSDVGLGPPTPATDRFPSHGSPGPSPTGAVGPESTAAGATGSTVDPGQTISASADRPAVTEAVRPASGALGVDGVPTTAAPDRSSTTPDTSGNQGGTGPSPTRASPSSASTGEPSSSAPTVTRAPSTTSAPPTSARPDEILIFTRTTGYRHPSIARGATTMSALGRELGYSPTVTGDPSLFTDAELVRFRAVVFM